MRKKESSRWINKASKYFEFDNNQNQTYILPFPLPPYLRTERNAGNPRFFLSGLCANKKQEHFVFRWGIGVPSILKLFHFLTGKIVKTHTRLIFILTLEERNTFFTERVVQRSYLLKKGPFFRIQHTPLFSLYKKHGGSESGAMTEK